MKKTLTVLALLLAATLLMTGCTDMLFTTSTYRSYQRFASGRHVGLEKQEVFEKLGYPDGCRDAEGNYTSLPYTDREACDEIMYSGDAKVWVYECYKYRDPRDPHRLEVSFDGEGECQAANIAQVGGG